MKNLFLASMMIFISCALSWAESSVWKVSKGDSLVYLGGTCHVLRESDYPLPAEFDKAYRSSEMVVLETDLAGLAEPSAQQKLLARGAYADGSSVEQHLSPAVYARLKEHCAASNIPLDSLGHLKPFMLMVSIVMLELAKQGISQHGVDQFFHDLATKEGKRVAGLETVDEQIDYVVSMADGIEDEFVLQSLNDLDNLKEQFPQVLRAWRTGDSASLDRLLVDEMKSVQPVLYNKLITARNRNWLPMIDAYLATPRTEFILVGAAHLVGADGIVEALKKKGYRVEKL